MNSSSLYTSTRAQQMELVDWSAAQKQKPSRMYFHAQDHSYRWSSVQQTRDEIQLMDIRLLPRSSILEKDEDTRRTAKQ
jgi:hypothetical protein